MEKSIKDKILFVLPPFVLALLAIIWYVRADGRWYTYRSEWEFLPLLACHLVMPLYFP